MHDDLHLNVQFLRRRVPNLTVAARNVGLRSATVSDLCNGKIPLGWAKVRALVALADLADCSGSAGLVARQGMGQVVLLLELIRRLRQRGLATVVWLQGNGRNEAAAEAEAVGTSADEVYGLGEKNGRRSVGNAPET